MEPEAIYRAQHHPGFEIWIGMIILSIVIGIIFSLSYQKNTEQLLMNHRKLILCHLTIMKQFLKLAI